MKNAIFSLMSILALSGTSYAGGYITPVEAVVEAPIVIDHSALYVGFGFGQSAVNDDMTEEEISNNTVVLQVGYQYNQYIALEGRYSFGFNTDYDPGTTGNLSGDYDGDFSSWGLYLKPIYPMGDFAIYGLLGYGGVMLDNLEQGDAYESGFQWGLGVSYAFTDTVSVFADYISLYDDTGFDYRAKLNDVNSDTWTIGLSYKF